MIILKFKMGKHWTVTRKKSRRQLDFAVCICIHAYTRYKKKESTVIRDRDSEKIRKPVQVQSWNCVSIMCVLAVCWLMFFNVEPEQFVCWDRGKGILRGRGKKLKKKQKAMLLIASYSCNYKKKNVCAEREKRKNTMKNWKCPYWFMQFILNTLFRN